MEAAAVAVDTTVLVVLGSAFGLMFATLTTLLVGSIRAQHRDSTETRGLITKATKENRVLVEKGQVENRALVEKGQVENRALVERAAEKLSAELAEHRRITEKNHDELKQTVNNNHQTTHHKLDKITDSLADARERLARIEGHLGHGGRPPFGEPGEGTSNAA